MTPREVIAGAQSSVVRIDGVAERGKRIPLGSGFLTKVGLVTCTHVIRASARLEGYSVNFRSDEEPERLMTCAVLEANIEKEYPADGIDLALLSIVPPPDVGQLDFSSERVEMGSQVVFMGFPFGAKFLTAHVGFISAEFTEVGVRKFQIDGSINGGNSGGPLLDCETGCVIGVVASANVGFIVKQFDALMETLEENVKTIRQQRQGGFVKLGGIDALQAFEATMNGVGAVAMKIRESANVGIGYAHHVSQLFESN